MWEMPVTEFSVGNSESIFTPIMVFHEYHSSMNAFCMKISYPLIFYFPVIFAFYWFTIVHENKRKIFSEIIKEYKA